MGKKEVKSETVAILIFRTFSKFSDVLRLQLLIFISSYIIIYMHFDYWAESVSTEFCRQGEEKRRESLQ